MIHLLPLALLLAGCANETLIDELGTAAWARPVAAAEPCPTAQGQGPDGSACTSASDCRSGYCSASVCEHTNRSESAALADSRPAANPPAAALR